MKEGENGEGRITKWREGVMIKRVERKGGKVDEEGGGVRITNLRGE